ncbi:MAG: acyltransferase family protein, partial [Bacteroidia bacterium]
FFVVAGFFGSMLFYQRRPKAMIKNRLQRIVFPFVVFLLIMTPMLVFAFGYSQSVFAGDEHAFANMVTHLGDPLNWLPRMTYHLWFLYYLILTTGTLVVLGTLAKKVPAATAIIKRLFDWLLPRPFLRILVLGACTYLLFQLMGIPRVRTSPSLIPDLNTYLYYCSFYLVGWIIFKSKHLLDSFMRYDWLCTLLGLVIIIIQGATYASLSNQEHMLINSVIVWLFFFGITGLFIRYGSKYSARMRYISDSSYWAYLIHLMFTGFLPGLIADWPLPATAKFLFVMMSTGIVCFVTYHYLVRPTYVGAFLNGRKYPI